MAASTDCRPQHLPDRGQALGLEDRVALAGQETPQREPHASSSSTRRILRSATGASFRAAAHRKAHGEARAAAFAVLGDDASAVRLDHPLHDGQAQAGPALAAA